MLYKIKLGENEDALNGYRDKDGNPRENELNTRMSDIESKHGKILLTIILCGESQGHREIGSAKAQKGLNA